MTRDRPRTRQGLLTVIGLAMGLVGVVAMHGVSAHVSPVHQIEHATGAAPRHLDRHTQADHPHSGDSDDQVGGHDSCEDCVHAGSLCALIVAGTIVIQPRPKTSIRRRATPAPVPPARVWSPDPPVPKNLLVDT